MVPADRMFTKAAGTAAVPPRFYGKIQGTIRIKISQVSGSSSASSV
jgi:hypothetical protein